MTIDPERKNETMTLHIGGRLDTITSPELENAINSLPSEVTALILDLKELSYVSSAGLRVLLVAQKKMNHSGGTMKLTGVCAEVMDVLDMTGFADILVIE